ATTLPTYVADLAKLHSEIAIQRSLTRSMNASLQNCYHGGAFFDAIGTEFDQLNRRHNIINADVLDAWFEPSPKVITAFTEALPWLLRTSPPTHCEGLIRVIARTRGVSGDCILP